MVTVESVEVHKAVAEQEQEQEQQQTTNGSTDEEAGWMPLDILEG
jgi:hypothetical protein